jgi:hypothetical protein
MGIKLIPGLSEKYVDKFMEAATAVIMDEVTNTSDENKEVIARFTARDMARGAIFMRDRHILTGVGIGVGVTALAFTIGNKIKNRKKNKEVVEFDLDTMESMLKDEMDEMEVQEDESKEELKAAMDELRSAFKEESVSQPEVTEEQVDEGESIMDKINDILKKPSNLDDLKAVIEELRKNEK